MNATTHTLTRLSPLALCLALTACGGGGGSGGGQLGTIDPIPLPLDEDYAPVAARLAVTYPAVIAASYNELFDLAGEIESECDDFLTETDLGDDTYRIQVDHCMINTSTEAPITTHKRVANLLLTYTELSPDTRSFDITTFEDDIEDIEGFFRTVQLTRADGTFTATPISPDGLILTDTNAGITQRVNVYDSNDNLVEGQSGLQHFRLQDYDLTFDTTTPTTSASHNGRLTVYVGAIEAYVDIETNMTLMQNAGEDCPYSGQLFVTGANDEEMAIVFTGTDVSVAIEGYGLDYPLTCDEFIEWIAEEQ